MIADALDGSGLALADVAPTVGGTADREPSEVLLTGVLLMAQDLARHQRTLQDGGLALHEGRDAVIVGILIATAVLLVGGVVLAQLCENGNDAACKASPILFGLALLLLAAVVCVAETPVSGGAPGFLCAAAVGTALSFASAIVE